MIAYVDDIVNLQDPELFRHLIESELEDRKKPGRTDIRKNPSYVAKVVGTRWILNLLILSRCALKPADLQNT